MKRFYLGMNYNGGGIEVAKKLIPELEKLTGHQCTSRWVWSEAHEGHDFRLTIASTDLADIARADYVILAPLTGTARGCHVEMGLAIGLDKPTYLYRPEGQDGVGFDALCKTWKPEWVEAIERLFQHPTVQLTRSRGETISLEDEEESDEGFEEDSDEDL